jgi:hypothetical protein
MAKLDFIAEIIKKNWFQEVDDMHEREWTFSDDINGLSESQVKSLISILFECLEIQVQEAILDDMARNLSLGQSYKLDDLTVERDLLIRTLLCITISG